MIALRVFAPAILGCLALHVFGNDAPRDRDSIPNFDRRSDLTAPVQAAPALPSRWAADSLAKRVAGVKAERDPITQSPRWIASTRCWLTGADGEGGAVSSSIAAAFARGDRARGVKAFLN